MVKTGVTLAFLGCLAVYQSASSAHAQYRVQEGFPQDEISRLQHRNGNFRKGLQAFNSQEAQSLIIKSRVWINTEQPLTVAFLGGSDDLKAKIISAANAWSQAANIKFDFGAPGAYRQWTRSDLTYAADIRIAFDQEGYWSFVGSDCIDPAVTKPSQASMNLQDFDTTLPDDWQGVVRHEFGHAIGFQHEHQSPAANCNAEFRFDDDPGYVPTKDMYEQFVQDPQGRRPGIYTVLGGPPNKWPRAKIDFNLKQLPNTTDLRFSAFDSKSIMVYSFQSWMFVSGDQSSCYTPENLTLSQQDQSAASQAYPSEVNAAVSSAIQNMRSLQAIIAQPHLSQDIKSQAAIRLQKMQ